MTHLLDRICDDLHRFGRLSGFEATLFERYDVYNKTKSSKTSDCTEQKIEETVKGLL